MKSLTSIKKTALVLCGIVIAVTASYAMATVGTWRTPGTPPNANADILVDTGVTNQVKSQGDLSVGSNGSGTFAAYQNASFASKTLFGGMLRGGTQLNTNSTLNIGGVDASGVRRIVSSIISGGLNATGAIQADSLKSSTGATVAICANQQGVIAPCAAGVVSTKGSSGNPNTNYAHIPPVYINISPDRHLNGTNLNGMHAFITGPALNAVGITVHFIIDPSVSKEDRLNVTCDLSGSYSMSIPAGSTMSAIVTAPLCNGIALDAVVDSVSPQVTMDNRLVLPPGATSIAIDSSAYGTSTTPGKGGGNGPATPLPQQN